MPYLNQDLPKDMTPSSTRHEAIIGRVNEDTTTEEMVAALEASGIDGDLDGAGSFLGRLFGGSERANPRKDVVDGRTLVGIFGLHDDQQDSVASAATEAGITITRRYGKWTYT